MPEGEFQTLLQAPCESTCGSASRSVATVVTCVYPQVRRTADPTPEPPHRESRFAKVHRELRLLRSH